MIVGLVGGVASGKSFVGRTLAELSGGVVINADEVAREVVQQPHILKQLCDEFGSEIVDASGQLIRTQLAALVFGDSSEAQARRLRLNAIVHPEVRIRSLAKINEVRAKNHNELIVIDAPLLLETGWGPVATIFFLLIQRKNFAPKTENVEDGQQGKLLGVSSRNCRERKATGSHPCLDQYWSGRGREAAAASVAGKNPPTAARRQEFVLNDSPLLSVLVR